MSLRQLSRSFRPLSLPMRTMTQLSGRRYVSIPPTKEEEEIQRYIQQITRDLKQTNFFMNCTMVFSGLTVFFLLARR